MSMYIFTHTHAYYVLCIVCIYIYIIYIPGSTMVTACPFPNFLGSARQLRESRTPAADITWALPIILIRFPRMDARAVLLMWFQGSFLVEISCQQRFPQEFHSSCPVTPVPSEVGCCLSTNQYTLVTEAVFHSGQGTTPPFSVLWNRKPPSSGLSVDFAFILNKLIVHRDLLVFLSILHKARISISQSIPTDLCRWII